MTAMRVKSKNLRSKGSEILVPTSDVGNVVENSSAHQDSGGDGTQGGYWGAAVYVRTQRQKSAAVRQIVDIKPTDHDDIAHTVKVAGLV